MATNCTSCGIKLEPNDSFCPSCGTAVTVLANREESIYVERMNKTQTKKWKGVFAGGIACLLALLALIAPLPLIPVVALAAVAAAVALIAIIIATIHRNINGVGVGLLAIVLSISALWALWFTPQVQGAYNAYVERARAMEPKGN